MPNLEKMNAAKLQLIEEEKKKLQVQQKALDPNAQMSLSEIKALQKENNKKIIDRILFVLGLIMATVLICIIVWPMFSTSMNFFNFKNPDAAFNQGTITATPTITMKADTDIQDVTWYRFCDPNKCTEEHTHNHLVEIDKAGGEIFKASTNSKYKDYGVITVRNDSKVNAYESSFKEIYKNEENGEGYQYLYICFERGDAIPHNDDWIRVSLTSSDLAQAWAGANSFRPNNTLVPDQGASAWGFDYHSISRLEEFVNEYNQDIVTIDFQYKAARGIFFAGFAPHDTMLCTLYCICGLLFFIFLIAIIVGYVILMSYGIRYFVGLIKGVLTGTKSLVVETGRNVAGAVLEETADKTLETSIKESERKRKAAADKRKATMAKKKAAQQKEENPYAYAKPVDVVVGEDDNITPTVKSDEPVLDELTDAQLDALLNGQMPVNVGSKSLFADDPEDIESK